MSAGDFGGAPATAVNGDMFQVRVVKKITITNLVILNVRVCFYVLQHNCQLCQQGTLLTLHHHL